MSSPGYLDDPKSTDAILHDGWLATGDLGALDEDGYLTITGRKKEILVTSGGKSVSPVGLEERVRAHPLVAQCIVVGNDRPYVAALVTVDQEAVDHWLAMQDKQPLPPADLVRDPDLEMEIRRAVVAANTAGVPGGVDPHVPHPGAPLQRGARAAHPVAEAQAEGDRDRLRERGRRALPLTCATRHRAVPDDRTPCDDGTARRGSMGGAAPGSGRTGRQPIVTRKILSEPEGSPPFPSAFVVDSHN